MGQDHWRGSGRVVMSSNALGARSGGALARVRKLRSLDLSGKGDAHLVDEIARGDAMLSLEGSRPIFPRWSAKLSSVEADEYERLSLGGHLGLKSL
jgi:hypothetical protein